MLGNNRQNKTPVVLSIDYDGCGAILNPKQRRKYPSWSLAHLKCFKNRIKEDVGSSKRVDVFVGSNRQSNADDRFLAKQNKNGQCFETYRKFCEKNNKKNGIRWTFRPLLLPDIEFDKISGSAMTYNYDCQYNLNYISSHGKPAQLDRKVRTVQGQLDYVSKFYKNKAVEFYFYDDDRQQFILPGLKKKLNVPKNITLHLVKCDTHHNTINTYDTMLSKTKETVNNTMILLDTLTKETVNNTMILLDTLRAYSNDTFKQTKNSSKKTKHEKVISFIKDTKRRLSQFSTGNGKAFDDYITHNQDNIKTLQQNRTTSKLWASIAVCLIPIIGQLIAVGGLIQLAYTKGNQCLFWKNNGAKSGELALAIQDNINTLPTRHVI